MGEVLFAEIDAREFEEQTLVEYAQSVGSQMIYIVDKELREDHLFQKELREGLKDYDIQLKVFTEVEIMEQWELDEFGEDEVFLLLTSIAATIYCVEEDLPIPFLSLGPMPLEDDKASLLATLRFADYKPE